MFFKRQKHSYKIVGYKHGSQEQIVIYEGNDYSCVSDMMPNRGEHDSNHGRYDLYDNGVLVESAETRKDR